MLCCRFEVGQSDVSPSRVVSLAFLGLFASLLARALHLGWFAFCIFGSSCFASIRVVRLWWPVLSSCLVARAKLVSGGSC